MAYFGHKHLNKDPKTLILNFEIHMSFTYIED